VLASSLSSFVLRGCVVVFVFSALRNAEVSSGILSERPNCFFFCYFVLDDNSSNYKRDSFEDYEEDGRVVWFERVKREFGSGSYG
jgi:hypothetical protein